MKVVSSQEYEKAKVNFLHKHDDWKVKTSPMNEYGQYYKTYICTDGAVWNEVNEPEYAKAEAETTVKGVKVILKQDIKLFRTEGWSTDNAESIVCYEVF